MHGRPRPGAEGRAHVALPELFEEAIEAVVDCEALHVEALAEHIARHIVGRQSALRAEARITAHWPVRRTTPVSGLPTQEMVSLVGIAAASDDAVRRVVGVEANGINACPCAQGLVRGRAAERLGEAGLRGARRRANPRARPARDPQPARPRHALRRHGAAARRERPRRDRRELDERSRLRAAEAARRALRRRARAPAAALRRGLGAARRSRARSRSCRNSRTATSSSRARSTSRRSTRTTCSPSARGPWASCARELDAGEPPARHTSLADWLRAA